MLKAIFGNSLLAKFGRRWSDSLRDAGSLVEQMDLFKRALPDLEQQARSLDQNQVEQALTLILEVRAGLRDLTRKVAMSRGHLAETDEIVVALTDRLATGAHLSQPENLEYLLRGDIEGMALYINSMADTTTFRRALEKVRPEQKAALLEALLKDQK